MPKSQSEEKKSKEWKKEWRNKNGNMGGGVYGLGLIGAIIYYIQNAQSFQQGLIGIFKAFFWPAFLVYKLIELLKI